MATYTKDEIRQHRLEWVEALESGKYKQAWQKLRDGNRFCCLGVACDLSGIGGWDKEKGSFLYTTGSESNDMFLPPEVQEWLGVRSGDPWLGDAQASVGNDLKGWSFEDIARRARKVWGL